MTTITGEAGHVLEFPLSLGAMLDGTTVTSAIVRVRPVRGGPFINWDVDIEDQEVTSLLLTYEIPEQLESGVWAAAGTVEVSGAASVTLGGLGLLAMGTVNDGGALGELAATLGALECAAVGTVDVAGTASRTLGALTLVAGGAVAVTGTAARTLGAATLAAAGSVGATPTRIPLPTFGAYQPRSSHPATAIASTTTLPFTAAPLRVRLPATTAEAA